LIGWVDVGSWCFVIRDYKPLSLLSFSVIVCRVVPCVFIFLKGWDIFKNNFSCVGFASSLTKLGLSVGSWGFGNVLANSVGLNLYSKLL
jgi:hypothetical protein